MKLLAWCFWVWSAALAFGGGVVGASLNCGEGEICRDGFPSWLEPWTWGDYSVNPEVSYISAAGLAAASAFLVLTLRRQRLPATIALLLSVVLLSYPYFAGLTDTGRGLFVFGPLLGAAAVIAMHRSSDAGAAAGG